MSQNDFVKTEEGRASIILNAVATEGGAVQLLRHIGAELDEVGTDTSRRLIPMVKKHLSDEMRHEDMFRDHASTLGLNVNADSVKDHYDPLMTTYREMKPANFIERYALMRVLEEQAVYSYATVAQQLAPYDQKLGGIFASIADDERTHVKYCDVIDNAFGSELSRKKLDDFRRIYRERYGQSMAIEVYDHAKHFEEINAWGGQLDPRMLGCGLVIPDHCCGFVDGVGATRMAYFYALRANPKKNPLSRARAILKLERAIMEAARNAGYVNGVTETSNPVVERFWVEHHGFKRTGNNMLEGTI